jgi:hypothetical protein
LAGSDDTDFWWEIYRVLSIADIDDREIRILESTVVCFNFD